MAETAWQDEVGQRNPKAMYNNFATAAMDLEVCQSLRTNKRTAKRRFILLSANHQIGDLQYVHEMPSVN